MLLRIVVFAVNQVARLAEGAIMRFPLVTDWECDLDDLHSTR